jgi:hypothetical protein
LRDIRIEARGKTMHKFACLTIAAVAFSSVSAGAATPFPEGYGAAYQQFVRALPPKARDLTWLTKLTGVTSPPKTITIGGKPALYLFVCKNHSCDTDNANIFLGPDRRSFSVVLEIGGAQTLLGGAGALELACVRKLDVSGGAIDEC